MWTFRSRDTPVCKVLLSCWKFTVPIFQVLQLCYRESLFPVSILFQHKRFSVGFSLQPCFISFPYICFQWQQAAGTQCALVLPWAPQGKKQGGRKMSCPYCRSWCCVSADLQGVLRSSFSVLYRIGEKPGHTGVRCLGVDDLAGRRVGHE